MGKPRTIYPYDYDFISYDFLKTISPQPEQFELKQVLLIPKEDIEARHEYILSIIKDRLDIIPSLKNTYTRYFETLNDRPG